MLWLNSGNIFMVSCWEGNTISGVLGTYLLLSLRGLYQAPKWFNRSGGPTVTGHIRKFQCWGYSSLGCWLLSSEAASPKSWQELLSFSQHGVFCSRWLGDYIWGKVWVERHYFIGLTSRSITQLRTQAFSVWLECGFSNYETWCYLQPRKILFDSSGNPLWTSPDYHFDFAL